MLASAKDTASSSVIAAPCVTQLLPALLTECSGDDVACFAQRLEKIVDAGIASRRVGRGLSSASAPVGGVRRTAQHPGHLGPIFSERPRAHGETGCAGHKCLDSSATAPWFRAASASATFQSPSLVATRAAMRKPVATSWPGVLASSMLSRRTVLARFGSRSASVIAIELRLMTMALGIPERRANATDSSTVGSISLAAVPPRSAQLTL